MMLQGLPPMPKPKPKKRSGGIAGMIQALLDRGRTAGRPPLGDMIPGAPRPAAPTPQPFDEYELRYGGLRGSRDEGRVGPPADDLVPPEPVRRPILRRYTRPLSGGGR